MNHLEFSRRGGRVKSPAKTTAGRNNLKKARRALKLKRLNQEHVIPGTLEILPERMRLETGWTPEEATSIQVVEGGTRIANIRKLGYEFQP